MTGGSADQEVEIAWKNFLIGTTNGLMLELGAKNGKSYSASAPFEEEAGWEAILIEASSPAADIPINRPNALSFQLAVCQKEAIAHFVNAGDMRGILEFMTPQFVMKFHSHLVNHGMVATSKESTSKWRRQATLPKSSAFHYKPFLMNLESIASISWYWIWKVGNWRF